MTLILILLILASVYSYAFYFTGLSLWFYFLWVPLSLVLSFLSFVLFVWIVFIYMKRTDPKGAFRHWLLYQVCGMMLFFTNVHVKVIGKEWVPNQTYVCYANHKSDLDPIILYHSMHRICSALGKKPLFKHYIIRECQKVFNVLPLDRDNDREAAKSIIEAIRALRAGLSYMIFPEGGIKSRETEEMVDLKAGAYKLVTKSEVLLLPATILGSSKLKGRSLLKRAHITVIFHKPLSVEDYKDLNTTEIGNIVRDIIHEDVVAYEKKHFA